MKRLNLLIVSILLTGTFFSCSKTKDENLQKDKEIPNINLSAKQKAVVASINNFGIDIFKQVYASEDVSNNLFISPVSISFALGMTYNGANTTTKDAMEQALRFNGMDRNEINQTFKTLIDYLEIVDPKILFTIANSIWYRNDFSILQGFLDTNQKYFNATVSPLDFNNPGSKDIINNWVAQNTNNKIRQIIDEIKSDDIMYLINAIYFKGTWKFEFNKSNTHEQIFNLTGGTKNVPMMYQKGSFNYFANSTFQAVELPYGNGRYNMLAFLPKPGKTVADIVNELNPENYNTWLGLLQPTNEVEIYLPKFKFEYKKELSDVLKAMGMGIAFTDMADFSNINGSGGLLITAVNHKTYVDVNEEGTEAAAVTSVTVGVTSIGNNPVFLADKPFLFAITEKETKSIVFIGQVANPEY
jgi:serine protease inhibitor